MAKPRDHKAEYERRIRNALARGLSRSEARGHPGARVPMGPKSNARSVRTKPDPLLEKAITAMRDGESLGAVAKRIRVGRERLSAYAKQYAGASRQGGAWTFNDKRSRRIPVIASDSTTFDVIRVGGFEPAHLAGEHYQQAEAAKEDPRLFPAFIERWRGKSITDLNGRVYELSVDPSQLYRATSAEEIDWTRIYHLYMH